MSDDLIEHAFDSKKCEKIAISNNISASERVSLLKRLSETLKYTIYGVFNSAHEKIIEHEKTNAPKRENNTENKNLEKDKANYNRNVD